MCRSERKAPIEEYKVDERNVSSYALRFKAQVKIKDHDWIKWYPTTNTFATYGKLKEG